MAEYIARGHAFSKHVEGKVDSPTDPNFGQNVFRDTRHGPDLGITTPEDLQSYIQRMLDDPGTQGFRNPRTGALVMYNRADNTILFFDAAHRTDPDDVRTGRRGVPGGDLGSIYRLDDPAEFERLREAARLDGALPANSRTAAFAEFNNATAPGTLRAQAEAYIATLRAPNNPRQTRVSENARDSLNSDPGVRENARLQNTTRNLTRTGETSTYRESMQRLPQTRAAQPALEGGAGVITARDASGRPSQMFFLDTRSNTVVEMRGREMTVHSFDALAEGERAGAARLFFEHQAATPNAFRSASGGYESLVQSFQRSGGIMPVTGANLGRVLENIYRPGSTGSAINLTGRQPFASMEQATQALLGLTPAQARIYNLLPDNPTALEQITDPTVRQALTELSELKGLTLSAGDDGRAGYELFREHIGSLNAQTLENFEAELVRVGGGRAPGIFGSSQPGQSGIGDRATDLGISRDVERFDGIHASLGGRPSVSAADVLADRETYGFLRDEGRGTSQYFNARLRAVVTVGPEGEDVRVFNTLDDAQHFYGRQLKEAAELFPSTHGRSIPDIFRGGAEGLADAIRAIRSGAVARQIAHYAGEGLEFLGRASKILIPVAIVAVAAEVASLDRSAQQLAQFGLVPREALTEYGELLAGHITQALADPSVVGGEVLTQTWFENWADRHDLSAEIRNELRPDSLLRDIQAGVEAANGALRNVADAMLQEALIASLPLAQEMIRAQIARNMPLRDLNPQLYDSIMQGLSERVINSDSPNALRDLLRDSSPLLSRRLSGDQLGVLNRDFGLSIPSLPSLSAPSLRAPSPPTVTPESGGWFRFRLPNFDFRLPRFEIPQINPFRIFKLGDAGADASNPSVQVADVFSGAAGGESKQAETTRILAEAYDRVPSEGSVLAEANPAVQNLASVKSNIETYRTQYNEQLALIGQDAGAETRAAHLFDRMVEEMDLFEQEYNSAVASYGEDRLAALMQPISYTDGADQAAPDPDYTALQRQTGGYRATI